MSIAISPLTDDDQGDWLELWAAYLRFYQHELSVGQTLLTFARITDDNYPQMWGAIARDEHGVALGFVHWLTHPSTWSGEGYVYLEDLLVAERARGNGVGRALIEYVVDWGRAHGHPKVYWQTNYGNETARRLYDKLAENEYIVYEIDLR